MMVEIKNAGKSFGSTKVLDKVNIEMEKGKIYGIVGRNGSGKTVLMKCICGFMTVDQGSIIVQGKEVGVDIDMPDNLGIIIETPGFLMNYSGYNNLNFLYTIKNKPNRKKIEEIIRTVGLDPKSKKHVGKYSLGMRQRLGIAQALMENPEILILDEPMNGLDNQGVEDIRKILLEQKEQGKTILIASHNREDIDILCDHVWQMDKGIATQIR